jgi:hypothetical protein
LESPLNTFFAQYNQAAGEGAVLELKLRLLANKVPELEPYVGERLEEVEEQIVRLFKKVLLEGEPERLRLCRQLRNKVLHCDFPKARAKLHEMGVPPVRGGVRRVSISNFSGEGIKQQLLDAASGKPGASQEIANLVAAPRSDVFGWLLELGNAGDFRRAAEVFSEASGIVDRLASADVPEPEAPEVTVPGTSS